MQFLVKVIVSALIIAAVSELGKRFTPVAAILASLPLTSIIAFFWLYADTKDVQQVSKLSYGVFWMVIPSLVFFIALPVLVKKGIGFYTSVALAAIITTACYFGFIFFLSKVGIKL